MTAKLVSLARFAVRSLLVLWSAPMTAFALLLALCCRCRFIGTGGPGGFVLCAVRPGSWLGRFFVSGGVAGMVPGRIAAVTIGQVVFLDDERLARDAELLRHEGRHVVQGFAYGLLHPIVYALGSVAVWAFQGTGWEPRSAQPYTSNPLEVDARAAER